MALVVGCQLQFLRVLYCTIIPYHIIISQYQFKSQIQFTPDHTLNHIPICWVFCSHAPSSFHIPAAFMRNLNQSVTQSECSNRGQPRSSACSRAWGCSFLSRSGLQAIRGIGTVGIRHGCHGDSNDSNSNGDTGIHWDIDDIAMCWLCWGGTSGLLGEVLMFTSLNDAVFQVENESSLYPLVI